MAQADLERLLRIPLHWDPAPEIWQLFEDRFTREDRFKIARAQLAMQKTLVTAQLEYLNAMEEVVGQYMK
jgi:hypothetical protein